MENNDYTQALQQLVSKLQPQTVITNLPAADIVTIAAAGQCQNPKNLTTEWLHSTGQIFDLAIIIQIETPELLAALRDIYSRKIALVIANHSAVENNQNLISLGFKQEMRSQTFSIWGFDLYDYKQTPDWLNAKYWANPRLWDQHRW